MTWTQITLAIIGSLCVLCSYWHWKTAVYGLVFWDAVRDPLRKLFPEHQIPLVMLGLCLWLACLLGCLRKSHCGMRPDIPMRSLKWGGLCLGAFLVIALIAAVRHSVPANVMSLGMISYLFPLVVFPIGVYFGSNVDEMRRWVWLYCLVHGLLLTTAVMEVSGFKSPVIGGIMMEWFRFRGDISIPLPSGVYRSPDILGLHAAHVSAMGVLLVLQANRRPGKLLAAMVTVFSCVMLVFSARRKMLGLFLSFLLTFIALQWCSGSSARLRLGLNRFTALGSSLIVLVIFGSLLLVPIRAQTEYALTVITELPQRLWISLLASPLATYQQTGFWGTGLGSATQGNFVVATGFDSGWQEDGIGRLVREGGVPGAVFAIIGIGGFVWSLRCKKPMGTNDGQALTQTARAAEQSAFHPCRVLPGKEYDSMTVGASVVTAGVLKSEDVWKDGFWALVMANLFCLVISHQHLSGDPVFGALLSFMAGMSVKNSRKTIDHV